MNFDSSATDDDGCIYEILGCTDPSAANYNDMQILTMIHVIMDHGEKLHQQIVI